MEKEKEKEIDPTFSKELLKLYPNDDVIKKLIYKYQPKETSTSKITTIPSIIDVYNTSQTSSIGSLISRLIKENNITIKENMNLKINLQYNKKEMNITTFITNFEKKFLTENLWLQEDYLVNVFLNVLIEEEDNLWYYKMLEERLNNKRPVTWKEIKIEIINYFTPKDTNAEIIKKVKQLKQKDDVESYSKEFIRIAYPLIKIEMDDLLIDVFKNGLKHKIREEIIRVEKVNIFNKEIYNKRITLDNYFKIAIELEKTN